MDDLSSGCLMLSKQKTLISRALQWIFLNTETITYSLTGLYALILLMLKFQHNFSSSWGSDSCPARRLHSACQHDLTLWETHENQLDMLHKARDTRSFQFSFVWYLTKIPYGLFCITRFLAWFPLEMRRTQPWSLPVCQVLLRNFFFILGCTSVRFNTREGTQRQ